MRFLTSMAHNPPFASQNTKSIERSVHFASGLLISQLGTITSQAARNNRTFPSSMPFCHQSFVNFSCNLYSFMLILLSLQQIRQRVELPLRLRTMSRA